MKNPILKSMDACELSKQYGYHGEHGEHPRADWKAEVASNDTQLGYWEWLEARLEEAQP